MVNRLARTNRGFRLTTVKSATRFAMELYEVLSKGYLIAKMGIFGDELSNFSSQSLLTEIERVCCFLRIKSTM